MSAPSTPPTPPLSAYRDVNSEEELFRVDGTLHFVEIGGNRSLAFDFDHISSYGWVVTMASTWLATLSKTDSHCGFFYLMFPTHGDGHILVDSREEQNCQGTVNVGRRSYYEKLYRDFKDSSDVEVTVVRQQNQTPEP